MIFTHVENHEINGTKIYLAINEGGEVKIGTKYQLERSIMPSFFPIDDGWVSLMVGDTWGARVNMLMHLHIKEGAVWCNIGKDLDINNTEFPFEFLNKLHYLALVKRTQIIRKENVDKSNS